MAKIGNSAKDAHNRRAKEFEQNQKRFQDASSAYLNDKGYSESSMEAVRRAAKKNKYSTKVRVGQHAGEI